MGIFDDLVNIEDISIEKKQEENRQQDPQQQDQQEEGNKNLKKSLYGDDFRKRFGDPK